MIRKLLPSPIKRKIRLIQRNYRDRKTGLKSEFATGHNNPPVLEELILSNEQPIFYNPLAANKVHNIELAIAEIEKVVIGPNQVFSFWHILGEPTATKGYKTGRNIIGDRLMEDIGGGLCQVSGMIYHLALMGGMEILERFNHTLDLYEEDKRYTPLGADATVVFGYKDLRFRNKSEANIQLKFSVSQTSFTGSIYASTALPDCKIRFEREEFNTYRTIKTYRTSHNKEEFINLSRYLIQH